MSKSNRYLAAGAALLMLPLAYITLRAAKAPPSPVAAAESRSLSGPDLPVGEGTARLFVDLGPHGEPAVIGIALSESALQGLPERMNTTSRCHDRDADGRMSHGECLGDYQTTLELPPGAESLELPFRWATLNWNPEGHPEPAPAAWSAPHFDFHFFLAERELIEGIRPGPCGEFIDCEDFTVATAPLPETHLPADYVDVGAAVPAMGNHLIDSFDPELLDPALGFSRTFIFGVYDSRVIFLEPMVTRAYIESRPNACIPVKSPKAWAVSGYYPTTYCVRHDPAAREVRVTLEALVYRQGEPLRDDRAADAAS